MSFWSARLGRVIPEQRHEVTGRVAAAAKIDLESLNPTSVQPDSDTRKGSISKGV